MNLNSINNSIIDKTQNPQNVITLNKHPSKSTKRKLEQYLNPSTPSNIFQTINLQQISHINVVQSQTLQEHKEETTKSQQNTKVKNFTSKKTSQNQQDTITHHNFKKIKKSQIPN